MGNLFVKPQFKKPEESFILWEDEDIGILHNLMEFNTRASMAKRRESNAFFAFKEFSFKQVEQKTFLACQLFPMLHEYRSQLKFPMTKSDLKDLFSKHQEELIEQICTVLNIDSFSRSNSPSEAVTFIFKNELKNPVKVHNKSILLGEIEQQIKNFVLSTPNLQDFDAETAKDDFKQKVQSRFSNKNEINLLDFAKLTINTFESKVGLNDHPDKNEERQRSAAELYLAYKSRLPFLIDFVLCYVEAVDMKYNCFSAEEFRHLQGHIVSQLKYFLYLKFKSLDIVDVLAKEVALYKGRVDTLTQIIKMDKVHNPFDNHNLRNIVNGTLMAAAKAYKFLKFDDKKISKFSFGIERVLLRKLKNRLRGFIYANTVIDRNSVVTEQARTFLEKIIIDHTPLFDVELFKQTLVQAFVSKDECVDIIFNFLRLFILYSIRSMDKKHEKMIDVYFSKLEKLIPIFEALLVICKDKDLKDTIESYTEALDDTNIEFFKEISRNSLRQLKRNFEKETLICRNLVIYLFSNVVCFLSFEEVRLDEVDLQGKIVNLLTTKIFAYTNYSSFFRAVALEMGYSLLNYQYGFSNQFLIDAIEIEFEKIKPNESEKRLYVNYKQPLVYFMESNKLRNQYLQEKLILKDYVTYSMSVESYRDELNVSKLFLDSLFLDKFFTFKNVSARSKTSKSRHVYILMGGISESIYGSNAKNEEFASAFKGSEVYEFKYQLKSFPEYEFMEEFESLSMLGFSNLPVEYLEIVKSMGSRSEVSSSSGELKNKVAPFTQKSAARQSYLGFNTEKNQWNLFSRILGKCLAFLISNTNTFANCTVSLVGLSFGGVVAWNCYHDLFLLGKADRVFDILLVGAPICAYEIDQISLRNLSGSLFNVFSGNDWVLKFIASNMEQVKLCCGTNKIKYSKSDLSKKVLNLNLSKEIYCQGEYYQYAEKIVEFLKIEKCAREFNNLIQFQTVKIPIIENNIDDVLLGLKPEEFEKKGKIEI